MNLKQKHPETCLAKCLMILLEKLNNKKIRDSYEIELLMFSLRYERENIARGHLEKVIKDFRVRVDWYADSKIFFDFLNKIRLPMQLSFIHKKINLKLIDSLLERPIILYIDRFFLWKKEFGLYYKYHYPHFIIVNRKINNFYEVIDPDDGKVKKLSSKILLKAIMGLKIRLWMSPQIIQLN
ncbi:MAG TPA: hypothetical protein VJB94_05915 [Candidatus Nanoarchaeia archaeon]|nr:hypothetical protein [Candidatus Nanoarchaeia archaeon]